MSVLKNVKKKKSPLRKKRKSSSKVKKKKYIKNNRRKKSAKRKKSNKKKKSNELVVSNLIISILISFIFYVIIFFMFFTVGKMDGYSMLPNVGNKDIVAVRRRKKIKRFDLIYLDTPSSNNEKSIRRVIGLPGDEIIFKNDELYVNGEAREEKYLNQKKKSMKTLILTDDFSLDEISNGTVVPENHYFVLGDNRKSSTDSRYYGFVPQKNVIGKVEFSFFSLNRIKLF